MVPGASGRLQEEARALAAGGHVVHAPLRPWLHAALLARSDRLYAWSLAQLSVDGLVEGAMGATPLQRMVRDTLDAHAALAIDIEPLLAPEVWRWYRGIAGARE